MEQPASEINFWKAFYSLFPLPQEREDARTALVAQTISNMSGRMIKDVYLMKMEDFLPDYLDKKKSKSQEDMERAFVQKALESGFGVMENK